MLQVVRSRTRAIPRLARLTSTHTVGRNALQTAHAKWNGRLKMSQEVEHALQTGAPVVALESTIITHGMPFPTNLETARSVEAIVRAHGAVPATIALDGGNVYVGLSDERIAALADPATVRSQPAVKVSRRDLAATLALGRAGGTTVAGTMVIAHSCGIGSFVTGGIGGVHRGAENSMDISADLIELGRTPMMVVCAGAKSILDIPRTLEVLETEGVCVATYGDKPDFPAFYTPSSGCLSPWQVDNVNDAAKLIYTGLTLPSPQATLLAVPIPAEYSAQGDIVQIAVEQAVRESVEQGIDKRGKEVTPWLLKRVGELTGGIALDLNIKLIENNAHVGAQVAAGIAKLSGFQSVSRSMPAMPAKSAGSLSYAATPSAEVSEPLRAPLAVVFGSAAIDITAAVPRLLAERTTTPGAITLASGGVARNIAHAAQKLLPAGDAKLIAAVGEGPRGETDGLGMLLCQFMEEDGLRTDGLYHKAGARTAACNLVLEGAGDLIGGVADMSIAETLGEPEVKEGLFLETPYPKVVAFDCNLTPDAIESILDNAEQQPVFTTLADPTSVPKLARLLPLLRKYPRVLNHITPNAIELDHIYSYLTDHDTDGQGWEFVNALNLGAEWRSGVEALARRLDAMWILDQGVVTKMVACLPWVGSFWLKGGAGGLVRLGFQNSQPESRSRTVTHYVPSEVDRADGQWLCLTHYPPPDIAPEEIVSTTGAGDTLAGSLVAGIALGKSEGEYVADAIEAVGRTLRSSKAVA